jgi:hypothetical protein
MRALIPALGMSAIMCFLLAGGSHHAAKRQAREPRRADGEGGVYQRIKERYLRQNTSRRLRHGSFLTLATITAYLVK